jgi:hypothetical protein
MLLLICGFQNAAAAYAGTVRGMLFRRDNLGRTYPAPYIAVSLNNAQYGRSPFVYTGADGMYYINAQPGSYWLEIWITSDRPIVYTIQVYNQPMTDIAPIQVP